MSEILEPGDVVAGYVIQHVVAQGGMGVVYRARQDRPQRDVALKLIAPQRAADPAYRERFVRESETLAGIEHPNIVPIHAAGEWNDQLYIAMRYIAGGTLADRLATGGPLSPAETIEILAPIADGLTAAHEQGIVHRDVKPANILLSPRGHVYLTDFGLTKRPAADPGLTRVGTALGTQGYMAPEQFTGQVDPALATRIDVYALGCVLHACLTGVEPYPADSYEASLWAHVFKPPPTLADREPALAFVDPVLARAMAKEPAERYATPNELIADLRERLRSAPPVVVPAPTPPPAAAPPTPGAGPARPTTSEPPPTVLAPAVAPLVRETPGGAAREAAVQPTLPPPGTPPPRAQGAGSGMPDRRLVLFGGLAAVGAVALFVVVANLPGLGGGDGDRSEPSPTPVATPTPGAETVAPSAPASVAPDPVTALINRLPDGVEECSQVAGVAPTADVAVQCYSEDAGGRVSLQYATFATRETLDGAWVERLTTYGFEAGAGSCPDTPGERGWAYEDDPDDVERGRLLCYVSDSNEAVEEWTQYDALVWIIAWRPGGDLAALDALADSGRFDLPGADQP